MKESTVTPEATLEPAPIPTPVATPIALVAEASSDAEELLSTARNHSTVPIEPSPDKYTWYIKDYVGLNLSSVGYTSMGGDRLERYGSGLIHLNLVTLDGSYVDIEDDDEISQYVIVGQSLEPNTEFTLTFRKDNKGEEYSNLVDYQSISSIDLLVVKIDGTITGNTIPYTFVPILPSPDRYTCYVQNYVGKNLATVGYTSMGGDRLDEYLAARIKLCLVTADGTYLDIEDSDLLQQYVIVGQSIAPNTEIKLVYREDNKGNEYDNLIDFCNIDMIDLQVVRLDGAMYNETAPYEPIAITPAPDKYTSYIHNYVGKNLASVGYTSMGGKRMDEYGNARLELVLVTPDRSAVDIEDDTVLMQYMVVEQDISPNAELRITYRNVGKGEEYSNLIESMSYEKITLTLAS